MIAIPITPVIVKARKPTTPPVVKPPRVFPKIFLRIFPKLEESPPNRYHFVEY